MTPKGPNSRDPEKHPRLDEDSPERHDLLRIISAIYQICAEIEKRSAKYCPSDKKEVITRLLEIAADVEKAKVKPNAFKITGGALGIAGGIVSVAGGITACVVTAGVAIPAIITLYVVGGATALTGGGFNIGAWWENKKIKKEKIDRAFRLLEHDQEYYAFLLPRVAELERLLQEGEQVKEKLENSSTHDDLKEKAMKKFQSGVNRFERMLSDFPAVLAFVIFRMRDRLQESGKEAWNLEEIMSVIMGGLSGLTILTTVGITFGKNIAYESMLGISSVARVATVADDAIVAAGRVATIGSKVSGIVTLVLTPLTVPFDIYNITTGVMDLRKCKDATKIRQMAEWYIQLNDIENGLNDADGEETEREKHG